MQASYSELIAEHEEITTRAGAILSDVDRPDVAAESLSCRLDALAVTVNDHVAREEAIIAGMDAMPMTLPWTETWQDGAAAFERLRGDWATYLAKWGAQQIATDRAGFSAESHEMLGRLQLRVEKETRAFYAAALQHGAIALR